MDAVRSNTTVVYVSPDQAAQIDRDIEHTNIEGLQAIAALAERLKETRPIRSMNFGNRAGYLATGICAVLAQTVLNDLFKQAVLRNTGIMLGVGLAVGVCAGLIHYKVQQARLVKKEIPNYLLD